MLDSTLDHPDAAVCTDETVTDFAPLGASTDLHWALKRRPQTCEPLPRRRVRPASSSFRPSAPVPLEASATVPAALDEEWPGALQSLWVGRFSVATDLDMDALPATVRKGQKLGSVRALGIDWPVLAPAAGVVRAMLADDASVVEYGQALVDFEAHQ